VSALAASWLAAHPRSSAFRDCPTGVQRRIIQLQLQQLGLAADFELIESLRLEPGKNVTVAAQLWLVADENGRVKKCSPLVRGFITRRATVSLGKSAGKFEFAAVTVSWRFGGGEKFRRGPGVPGAEVFDAGQIGGKIVLRHWRAGDRFQPIGMKAAVKLQDWFTNQKIPAARRRELVVATTERGEIFWVEGLRIGERFKLTSATRQQLQWQWSRAAAGRKSCIAGLPAPC
jgi:tRNA(Ile)-lysidine synthase